VLTLIVTDEAETMAQSLTIALSVPGQNSSKRDNKRVPDAETASQTCRNPCLWKFPA